MFKQGLADEIIGEILGQLLLVDESLVDHPLLKQAGIFAKGIEYQNLQLFRERVWLVASMKFKAAAVLKAVQRGLVGHLVIDSAIADWIVKNKIR